MSGVCEISCFGRRISRHGLLHVSSPGHQRRPLGTDGLESHAIGATTMTLKIHFIGLIIEAFLRPPSLYVAYGNRGVFFWSTQTGWIWK